MNVVEQILDDNFKEIDPVDFLCPASFGCDAGQADRYGRMD